MEQEIQNTEATPPKVDQEAKGPEEGHEKSQD